MKYKIITAIAAVILLAGVAGCLIVMNMPQSGVVNIIRDGKTIRTVDLNTASDEVFTVEYKGSSNTIEIKNGKIRVSSAECPDKTCVNMGWLSSSAAPIVCLPNHLVITCSAPDGGADAVSR